MVTRKSLRLPACGRVKVMVVRTEQPTFLQVEHGIVHGQLLWEKTVQFSSILLGYSCTRCWDLSSRCKPWIQMHIAEIFSGSRWDHRCEGRQQLLKWPSDEFNQIALSHWHLLFVALLMILLLIVYIVFACELMLHKSREKKNASSRGQSMVIVDGEILSSTHVTVGRCIEGKKGL